MPGGIEAARAEAVEPPAPGSRKTDEVLFKHHQLMRRLFEEIRGIPRDNPELREMMRLLASEPETHEHVEHELFYPAEESLTSSCLLGRLSPAHRSPSRHELNAVPADGRACRSQAPSGQHIARVVHAEVHAAEPDQ